MPMGVRRNLGRHICPLPLQLIWPLDCLCPASPASCLCMKVHTHMQHHADRPCPCACCIGPLIARPHTRGTHSTTKPLFSVLVAKTNRTIVSHTRRFGAQEPSRPPAAAAAAALPGQQPAAPNWSHTRSQVVSGVRPQDDAQRGVPAAGGVPAQRGPAVCCTSRFWRAHTNGKSHAQQPVGARWRHAGGRSSASARIGRRPPRPCRQRAGAGLPEEHLQK